jgi:hypothetical protein
LDFALLAWEGPPDRPDLIPRKARGTALLSGCLPSLANRVTGVVEVCPEKQMRGVHAKRVVAVVANEEAVGDWASEVLVGPAVSILQDRAPSLIFADKQLAVLAVCGGGPPPASANADCNLFQKPGQGGAGLSHGHGPGPTTGHSCVPEPCPTTGRDGAKSNEPGGSRTHDLRIKSTVERGGAHSTTAFSRLAFTIPRLLLGTVWGTVRACKKEARPNKPGVRSPLRS